LAKILFEAITTWKKRNNVAQIELEKADGTRFSIKLDPSQEESVRKFLTELKSESSKGKTAIEGGG